MSDQDRSMSERQQVNRAAGTVGLFTFLSRILGLVRDVFMARIFGAGAETDAFFVAFRIPNLLRRLFAEGSLTVAFIPVFTKYLREETKKDAFRLARVVLTLLSVILVVVTIIGVLCAPWIVRIQAPGFGSSGFEYDLTVVLTRITFPYILLISLVALFMGILNSLRHFAAPASAPIFLNVGIIVSMFLISPHFSEPIVGVAIGVIIGGILQVGLQIPWVLKKGVSLVPHWQPNHPGVKRIGLLMLPTIFGSAIYQLNQFMGTLLASLLETGSISWLYYADRLVQLPLGVFGIAIGTAVLPSLSRNATENTLDKLTDTLGHALRLVFFITIPSMVGLMLLGKMILQVFFEGGAFDAYYTDMTIQALIFYSLGLWAFSGLKVILSAYYSLEDTKTPVRLGMVVVVANLVFSLLLMGPLKHGGLALALSLSSTLQFALLVFFFRKKLRAWDLMPILISTGKSLVASLVMGLGIYYLNSYLWVPKPELGRWYLSMQLIGLVLIGATLYFSVAALLKCRELSSVLDVIGLRLRSAKSSH